MRYIISMLALGLAASAAPTGLPLSDLTGNSVSATQNAVDSNGQELKNIADQVLNTENSDSVLSVINDDTLGATQNGVKIITDGLERRRRNLIADLTGNSISATQNGVDSVGQQLKNIANQVVDTKNDDSVLSVINDDTLGATQNGVKIITDGLQRRRRRNLIADLTGNSISATQNAVDSNGQELKNIANQVVDTKNSDSVLSVINDDTLGATQNGLKIITDAVSEE